MKNKQKQFFIFIGILVSLLILYAFILFIARTMAYYALADEVEKGDRIMIKQERIIFSLEDNFKDICENRAKKEFLKKAVKDKRSSRGLKKYVSSKCSDVEYKIFRQNYISEGGTIDIFERFALSNKLDEEDYKEIIEESYNKSYSLDIQEYDYNDDNIVYCDDEPNSQYCLPSI